MVKGCVSGHTMAEKQTKCYRVITVFVHLIHLLTGFESVLLKCILFKLAIQQLEKDDRAKKY